MSTEIVCNKATSGSPSTDWDSRFSSAIKTKRHYVGYDINENYVKLAERRIKEFSSVFNTPKLFESALQQTQGGEQGRTTEKR